MAARDDKLKEWWHRCREKGRTRFIWLHGILGWGIPAGLIAGYIAGYDKPHDDMIQTMILNLFFFPIGGYFYGRHMWNHWEKKYPYSRPRADAAPPVDNSKAWGSGDNWK